MYKYSPCWERLGENSSLKGLADDPVLWLSESLALNKALGAKRL